MDNVGDLIGDVDNVDDLLIGSGWTRSGLLMEKCLKGTGHSTQTVRVLGGGRSPRVSPGLIHSLLECLDSLDPLPSCSIRDVTIRTAQHTSGTPVLRV